MYRRDQTYISLDLEFDRGDIIEAGVVFGRGNQPPSEWPKHSWLVQPRHGAPVSDEITRLTGITQAMLDAQAVPHHQLKQELVDLVKVYKPFVNPVQWGLGDAQELLSELDDVTGSPAPIFGRRVIDVKHHYLFIEAANGRSMAGGLSKAMSRHGLKFDGKPHRAVPDAYNTLRFYFHLLERQSCIEDHLSCMKKLYKI